MITDTIKWMVKERLVYNVDTKQVELMRFLQLNQIDTYNFGMGNVDIVDQLRGSIVLTFEYAIESGGGLFSSGRLVYALRMHTYCMLRYAMRSVFPKQIITHIMNFEKRSVYFG